MNRKTMLVGMLCVLAGAVGACTWDGTIRNPLKKETPFTPTAVPTDFAIIVNERHDTYYARTEIEQVVSSSDLMSRTTYTYFRDLNNTVANKFTQETPLNATQLQSMWNEVTKNNLMTGAHPWINFRSDADVYRFNTHVIRIRANGQVKTYRQTNGFSGDVRGLMLQVDAVRLPLSQNATQPRFGAPAVAPVVPVAPTTEPAMPTTEPATQVSN